MVYIDIFVELYSIFDVPVSLRARFRLRYRSEKYVKIIRLYFLLGKLIQYVHSVSSGKFKFFFKAKHFRLWLWQNDAAFSGYSFSLPVLRSRINFCAAPAPGKNFDAAPAAPVAPVAPAPTPTLLYSKAKFLK
jgi:hypothetical protein